MVSIATVVAPSSPPWNKPHISATSSSSSLFSHGLLFPSSFRRGGAAPPRTKSRPILRVSAATPRRRTLSAGWNLTTLPPEASRIPSLENLDTTNVLLQQRIVFLGSQVVPAIADLIISQLLFLDAEDQQKEIKLFINSPGGSWTSGMAIYDAMKLCKADISTVCLGIAASTSVLLLAAGTKGKRFCMPNGRIVFLRPETQLKGSMVDVALQHREISYARKKMIKILSRITEKPEIQIARDTRVEFYLNPWEAKEYGFVDAVIDDGKPGLVAPVVEAVPPPKSKVWHLWEGNRKFWYLLPSEEKLLQNGHETDSGSDGEESKEQPKEEPVTV